MPVASVCASAVAAALQAICAGAHPSPPVLTPSMEPALHIASPLAFEANGQHVFATDATTPPLRTAGTILPLFMLPLTADVAKGKIGFDEALFLGGATLQVDQTYRDIAPPPGVSAGDVPLKLTFSAPGVGLTQQLTQALPADFPTFGAAWMTAPGGEEDGNGEVAAMSYMAWGSWNRPVGSDGLAHAAPFIAGYETPVEAVPTTGAFTFGQGSLVHNVRGGELVPTKAGYQMYDVYGDATFNVDFATGKISGAFQNMSARNSDTNVVVGAWNDVALNGTITANTFSGVTAAGAVPKNEAAMPANAKGEFKGLFYGPNANQLGALWTLSSGQIGAAGSVGATR